MTRSRRSYQSQSSAITGARQASSAIRAFRTGISLCLGLISLGLGHGVSLFGQQIIHGEPGQAELRTVVNFRGLQAFEMVHQVETNLPLQPFPGALPQGFTNNLLVGAGGGGGPDGLAAASLSPAAVSPPLPSPGPTASFLAIPDNGTVTRPDPAGAVGTNHVMTAVNSQVRIQDKNGNILSTLSLGMFWQTLRPRTVSQPRLLYDPYENRWIFTTLADVGTSASSVLMGVSQTGDPTGNWFLSRVDVDRNNALYPDYSAVGFNKDWVVVTMNMFPIIPTNAVNFAGVNIYVFSKTNLYANGGARFTLLRDTSTFAFSVIPTVTYDNTLPVMHLVEVENLFHNLTRESSRLRLSRITGPVGGEVLSLGTGFTTATNDWASQEFASVFGGSLPQLGAFTDITAIDSRIANVVFRHGALWCTHNVFLPTTLPTHSAVQWWQLATNGQTIQFGRIEDPTAVTNYAFPSITVNRNEDALIGFSRFSLLQYPSANYALRSCADLPNRFRSDAVLKDGEGPYDNFFILTNFFIFQNPWGLYNATVVDPVNDFEMWTLQEYAALPIFIFRGTWGTWWGRVTPNQTCLRIEFVSPTYSVNEASPGFATITVFNLGGAPGTVQFATADGTAVAGQDYLARTGTLTFAGGQTETNFTVVVLDNAVVNSNKTVLLSLFNPSGPATLGTTTNATLIIEDDETLILGSQAGEFNFSSYQSGAFYSASEYETFIAPCGDDLYTITGGPERNAPGVLVTVTRTNGAMGRVLIDYETAEGGGAIPFVDYTPVSGTLVFDDFQMSTNFMVEVFPNSLLNLNPFGGPATFVTIGTRIIRVVLSNPRPAPEEEAIRPGVIRPKLGLGSESGIQVWNASFVPIFSSTAGGIGGFILTNNAFSFERENWRFDEYPPPPNAIGDYRVFNVQVLKPDGMGGSVRFRTRQSGGGDSQIFFLLPQTALNAGSDFAEAPFPHGLAGINVWPSPVIRDPALTTLTNYSDYLATNFVLTFGSGECRKNVLLVITNDPHVEFNEDIHIFLLQIRGQPPVNPFGSISTVTILFKDQPAGAVDREWNPWNIPGSDPPENRTPGADGIVRALVTQPDGMTILGGDFGHVNAVRRPGLARMGTNGALDRTFDPGNGVNGFVSSLILYRTNDPINAGKILVGGGFSSYDGLQRNGIARVLPNGQLDPTFFPGTGADGPVWGMALQADGKIVVVGGFFTFNDELRFGVVRLNSDGSLDSTFNVGNGADNTVSSVGLAPDPAGEKIIIGGDFYNFNGQFKGGVARLNPDGSLDSTFQTGSGVNGSVVALAVQADGRTIIAGSFSEINALKRINIARLLPNGGLDPAFDGGFGPDKPIIAITLQPDGKALIGGPFASYNGTRRIGFARLRLDGTLDTSFLDTAYNQFAGLIKTFSFEANHYAAAFSVQPDGNVMVGGSFTNIGGNPSVRSPRRNAWTVFTRADKQIRFNIARVIGGTTPGPGNAEFDSPEYYVNENADLAAIQMERTDGRLGTLTAIAVAQDRVATNNLDFVYTNLVERWREAIHDPPFEDNNGPINVGEAGTVRFRLAILDDPLKEGDETVGLSFLRPEGSLTLGGELIPLGGALGRASAVLNIADDDADAGIFNFAAPVFFTNENAVIALITVIRTNGSVGPVNVDYFTRQSLISPIASTNESPPDYRGVSGTLFFQSTETSHTFIVPIIDDNRVELDENIELVLTNATGGARLPGGLPTSIATATLTIIDNDFPPGRLNFGAANYFTNESAGVALISVTRSGGNLGAVSVDYITSDGTANAPGDYAATSGTLTWSDGDSSTKFLSIPLVADGIVDDPTTRFETVNLRLFNGRAGTVANTNLLGIRTNATLFIEDSDSFGVFVFNQSYYQADENSGAVTATIVRRNGFAGTASVRIEATPADPFSGGSDFYPTNGILTFLPGELSKPFTIALRDDTEADGNKDVILSLSDGINATVGSPSVVTLTLVDDESSNIPAGESDSAFGTNTQVNGPVYAMALQPDGRFFVAGEFTEVNHILRAGIARLNSDGNVDPSFNPGLGPNSTIRALALQPDSKIIVGGFFTQFSGTNRSAVVRLNSDGTVDTQFNPGAGANNPVFAIVLQPDDKVILAGAFSTFNSISRPGVVRLNTNGTMDLTFNPGSGANNVIYAAGLQADGRVVVGGDFTQVHGQTRLRLARLNADGSLDQSFNPDVALDAAVRTVLVQPDGKIVVGGSFTTANGVPRNYLARFNADGTLDNGFLPAPLTGADNAVYALALQVDGRILVAGDFRRFNGVTRNRLTRLNADGTTDPTINFGTGADSFIASLVIQPDRKILFGGGFTVFDEKPRLHIARIHGGSIAGNGSLEFSNFEFLVPENGTNATIRVRRRFGTTGAVSVDYRTVDGTAIAGVNYEGVTNTMVFPEGETQQSFLVPVFDNSVPNEDLRLSLELLDSTFTGGATNGPQPVARLIILDDEGFISFSFDSYNVGENVASGVAPISVVRHGGSNNAATVNFATSNLTAVAGSDYFATNGTLTFLPGETNKLFHVRIINDSNIEGNESLLLTLSEPSGSNLLGVASAILVIADNDFGPGRLQFSSFAYTNRESDPSVLITVIRTNGSSGIVNVDYATSDGTAIGGFDYFPTSGKLSFADGETVKTFEVPLIDDLLIEPSPDEYFSVRLINITNVMGGAAIGAISNATVLIRDNDTNSIIGVGSALLSESFTNPPNSAIDPGETVTVLFALRNIGNSSTTNLIATLLPGGGISSPDAPKSYGALIGGGPAGTNSFRFTANGTNGNRLTVTLLLTDSGRTNGLVTFFFTLGGKANIVLTNNAFININDNTTATPYPSVINVANVGGLVTNLTVTIHRLRHTYPGDIDMLLVGPTGAKATLMSDAGSTSSNPGEVNSVTLTFSDTAATVLPPGPQIVTGTYVPTNYAGSGSADFFPPPAPSLPYTNSALSVFTGINPIGAWSLYVLDDNSLYAGAISNGWSLGIQTSDPIAPASDLLVAASGPRSAIAVGQDCRCTITVTNYGPAPATNVVVSDYMPAGFALVSATPSTGTWSQNAGVLTFNLGRLTVGGRASIELVMRPMTAGVHLSSVSVKSIQVDLYQGNNSLSMTTIAVVPPALNLAHVGANIVLYWPANSPFVLQGSDALTPGSWTDITIPPLVSGGFNYVALSAGSERKFYRLRSP